jgi:lipoprotein-anchoring transpeptidase ErfK/SrfK
MALVHLRTSARRLRAAALLGVLAVGVAACSGSSGPSGAVPAGSHASPTALPPAIVVAATIPFAQPATFRVRGATLVSATVKGHSHGTPLPGHVTDAGQWVSDTLPVQGAQYDVTAVVRMPGGAQRTLASSFRVKALTSAQQLGYSVTPFQGWTVGVNAPIVIRFNKSVDDKAAVERALTVYTTTPLTGTWHWVNAYEVHFRPQSAWPVHEKVRLEAALRGVQAGAALWGTSDTTVDFEVGEAHLTKVDGLRHTLTLYISGNRVGTWPTSLGRPEFATRTGSYVVLSKQRTRQMTSCNAHITCDKNNPNWYDLTVDWDVRLTYSGTFIHSAPWSVRHQGVDNVSHGCINLSPSHATTYFGIARYGDLVTVTGTSRGPDDLLRTGDPGMADWNTSWATYVQGSALGGPVITQLLPA